MKLHRNNLRVFLAGWILAGSVVGMAGTVWAEGNDFTTTKEKQRQNERIIRVKKAPLKPRTTGVMVMMSAEGMKIVDRDVKDTEIMIHKAQLRQNEEGGKGVSGLRLFGWMF